MKKELITRKEVAIIKVKDMRDYIKNREQALRWIELTHNLFEFDVEFENGAKIKVSKHLIFEVARKRFFDEFYDVRTTEPRPMEEAAEEILRMFEEQEAATA